MGSQCHTLGTGEREESSPPVKWRRIGFHKVRWDFLFSVLSQIRLDQRATAWIKDLYSTPLAKAQVSGAISEAFEIKNVMRQGCPLSLPLFVLILKPFLCRVRKNPSISVLPMPFGIHKVAAYVMKCCFCWLTWTIHFRQFWSSSVPLEDFFQPQDEFW